MKITILVTLGLFVGVVTPVKNLFSECWSECNRRNGPCPGYCGSDGFCCRQGDDYDKDGCDGIMGGDGHHRCTPDERGKSVKYRGQDCWNIGGCSKGSCSWCGPNGYCCRIKDPEGTGCDGKIGGDGHHRCAAKLSNYDTNWMGRVSGEKYISQLTIPGTHNTVADQHIDCTWKDYYQCQDTTLAQQINYGVRFIDLRFRHKNNRFDIHHGDGESWAAPTCYLGYSFDRVIGILKTFLQTNSQETMLLSYSYYDNLDENNSRSFQETLDWYLSQNAGLFYQASAVPKLKDVRGKIVLINFGGYGRNTGAHGLKGKWNDNTVANNYDPGCDPLVNWPNGCQSYADSLMANMRRAKSSTSTQLLYITYLSASDPPLYSPKLFANFVNSRIHNMVLKEDGSKQLGIVVWDYLRDYHSRLVYSVNLI